MPELNPPKLSSAPRERIGPRALLLRRGRRFQADRETRKYRDQLPRPEPGTAPSQLRLDNRFFLKPQRFQAMASARAPEDGGLVRRGENGRAKVQPLQLTRQDCPPRY